MTGILAALAAFIKPAINYAELKLASVGAAFAGGLVSIAGGFTNDQRVIGTNCIAFWQAKYHAYIAANKTPFESAELATTETCNEFFSEEGAEFSKEGRALITLLESSVKNGTTTS